MAEADESTIATELEGSAVAYILTRYTNPTTLALVSCTPEAWTELLARGLVVESKSTRKVTELGFRVRAELLRLAEVRAESRRRAR